jgi:hypothetical protein
MKQSKHERLYLLLSIVMILLVFGIYQIYQVSLSKSKEEISNFNGNLTAFCAKTLKDAVVNEKEKACEFPNEKFNLAVKNGGLFLNGRLIIKDEANLSVYEKVAYLEDLVLFNQKLGTRYNLYAVSQDGIIYLLNTQEKIYKGNYEIIDNQIIFTEKLFEDCIEDNNQAVANINYYEYDGIMMSPLRMKETLMATQYFERYQESLVCSE